MPYKIRKSTDRKYFDHGWLKTYHTFSFGEYYDPAFMGFRTLRVINEDRVAPGVGFPPHQHKDMEIISLILEGSLAHKDSMGNASTIQTNEVQVMSAGSGITHSEFNPSSQQTSHFLQIWILPDAKNLPPRYEQKKLPSSGSHLIASKTGRDNSLIIHQDVELSLLVLKPQESKQIETKTRYGYLQVIEGELTINQEDLEAGDGVALEPQTQVTLKAKNLSRLLFFDLN